MLCTYGAGGVNMGHGVRREERSGETGSEVRGLKSEIGGQQFKVPS